MDEIAPRNHRLLKEDPSVRGGLACYKFWSGKSLKQYSHLPLLLIACQNLGGNLLRKPHTIFSPKQRIQIGAGLEGSVPLASSYGAGKDAVQATASFHHNLTQLGTLLTGQEICTHWCTTGTPAIWVTIHFLKLNSRPAPQEEIYFLYCKPGHKPRAGPWVLAGKLLLFH